MRNADVWIKPGQFEIARSAQPWRYTMKQTKPISSLTVSLETVEVGNQ